MLRTQSPDVVAKPCDRPRPADPLGDHRRWHVRMLNQDLPHQRLERRERCRHRHTLVLDGRSEANARSTGDLPIPRSRVT